MEANPNRNRLHRIPTGDSNAEAIGQRDATIRRRRPGDTRTGKEIFRKQPPEDETATRTPDHSTRCAIPDPERAERLTIPDCTPLAFEVIETGIRQTIPQCAPSIASATRLRSLPEDPCRNSLLEMVSQDVAPNRRMKST